MAETAIEWTHRRHPLTGTIHPGFTFNPWIGCTIVSEACEHCYAMWLDAKRFSKTLGGATTENPISHWGPGAPRHRTSPDNWKQPRRWNKLAREIGIPLAVFCGSLCDWADEEVDDKWRDDLLELIWETPNLDWLLLTKRVDKAHDYLTRNCAWNNMTPQNVWMGATMENQKRFDERYGKLLDIPAARHFASIEPALSDMDITPALPRPDGNLEICPCCAGAEHSKYLDWVIVGGESMDAPVPFKTEIKRGLPRCRPMHPDHALKIATQCWAAGVPFFFKQWGDWAPAYEIQDAQVQAMCAMGNVPKFSFDHGEAGRRHLFCVGKKAAGHHFNGEISRSMPPLRSLVA